MFCIWTTIVNRDGHWDSGYRELVCTSLTIQALLYSANFIFVSMPIFRMFWSRLNGENFMFVLILRDLCSGNFTS